uniref:Protein kinase domain-containing protein n=1 Tax=viral metagenome TaxID=1070528 RepID=A0A6C0K4E1_9ZZZZ
MKGGAVIGEGVDGCVLSEPTWPCAASSKIIGKIPNGKDKSFVSKIVKMDDVESYYLQAANRILGPQLSMTYLAGLRGMCSPANSGHMPIKENMVNFITDKKDLFAWKPKGQACEALKHKFKQGIAKTHKLMIISRYPSTLEEWVHTIMAKKIPINYVIQSVNLGIPSFLGILQMFYKHQTDELINLDLHHKNIFVRAVGSNIQFGISDFGRCLLRIRNNEQSSTAYFNQALIAMNVSQKSQPIYMYYRQIAFEARILHYCYMNDLERANPDELINAYVNDPEVKKCATISNDILIINLHHYKDYLLKYPLFIEMLEVIQGIIKKDKTSGKIPPYDEKEKVVLEFIITRYMAVSPIVTLLEQLLYLSDTLYDELTNISTNYFSGIQTDVPANGSGIYKLITYVNRMITSPYTSKGSLIDALTSIQSVDLKAVWADIV